MTLSFLRVVPLGFIFLVFLRVFSVISRYFFLFQMATIVHWNCRGLRANWEELRRLLVSFNPVCLSSGDYGW